MFEGLKLRRLRTKLQQSLGADDAQAAGWQQWLDQATTREELRERCSDPGWVVHLAYWTDVKQDPIVDLVTGIVSEHLAENLTDEEASLLADWRNAAEEELLEGFVRHDSMLRRTDDVDIGRPAAAVAHAFMVIVNRGGGRREPLFFGAAQCVALVSMLFPDRRDELLAKVRAELR